MLRFLRKRRVLLTYCLIIFVFYLCFSSYQSDNLLVELKEQVKQLRRTAQPYQPICKIPELQIINHEKSQIEKKCRLKQNWGDISQNKWHFIPEVKEILHLLTCQYRAIFRVDDTKYLFSNWFKLNDAQLILDEVFEVVCKRINSTSKRADFDNLYVQLVNKWNKTDSFSNSKSTTTTCKPLSIILLSYDSVSRSSWFKRVPKSTQYALDVMKFQLLNGYNIVGDGTPAALIPIYSGKTEEELPSVLRNDPKARYVDEAYPFIWKDLHKKNYVSMHLDDWPHIGAFSYRMKGFLNHTTTHYLKHYQLRLWDRVAKFYYSKNNQNDDFCMGSKKRHKILLDLILDFKRLYNSKTNNLVLMHYVENSHDTNERFNWVDADLFNFLHTGHTQNLFENTAIFLFSDHGSRFTDKRSSNNRYLEERLPFFAIYLPDKYKKENPEKIQNLITNSQILTSPFDIYATVRELTCLEPPTETSSPKSRSISLLNQISNERNCENIGISEHYCTCIQNWQTQKLTDSLVVEAAKFSVESINKLTYSVRNLCMELGLKQIISAEVLKKNEHLIYKIQLITRPNNGVYEALLYDGYMNHFEFKSQKFSISSRNEISRIDAYGEQPYCVSNFSSNPAYILDLRKFCFCKIAKSKLKPWLIRKKF